MKVLIIEDDKATASFIARGLAEAGHHAQEAHDGPAGLSMALERRHDAIIVDRMLPGLNGIELIEGIRAAGLQTPILILTALDAVDERVVGLEAGADDYLVKPFALNELIARLSALYRRPALREPSAVLRVGDLEVDVKKRRVTRAGKRIDLTPQEFKLLEYLVRRPGETITRMMLLEQVWGMRFDPRTNVVEAHMSRLRAKIDREHEVELIRTQHGAGYVLDAPS
ncbi:MAG: response regulator [Hyphomonadaceae bacterium]